MLKRTLFPAVHELAFSRGKMAFVSGPRQVGKTTFSKQFEQDFDFSSYCNWDVDIVARAWAQNPAQLVESLQIERKNKHRLLILDEIHKSPTWKRKLKGLYDVYHAEVSFLVTGSARLNVYNKGGDSLMGRYLYFRLNPLSLGELLQSKPPGPEAWKKEALGNKPSKVGSNQILKRLFDFSGFPEPFLAKSHDVQRLWRTGRREKIVREDLRDLNRVQEIAQLQTLALLLPEKVGSPLSLESLREDLSTSHDSIKRWLGWFRELYYHFELKPWSKDVKRSLKKEGKIYLYDWTEIPEEGPKFENMVAVHLLKACQFWSDTGKGEFELFYLRNKEKQEIDFLIVKDRKPWLAVETKNGEPKPDLATFEKFGSQLGVPFVLCTKLEDVFWKHPQKPFFAISADDFLADLP